MRSTLRKPLALTMAAAALSLAALGCAKDEAATSTAPESTTTTVAVNSGEVVEITNVAGKYAFEPDIKEVKVNEAVIWKNTDTTKHTVTASADQTVSFKSPTMTTDAEFVQTFAEPGTYTYFCSIHGAGKMSGTITVVP
jgi:plastocyanin